MNRPAKFALLSSLYLAQGLPFGFFTQALPVLMRDAGLSLKAISATSLLFLPWALKFLWAPLVDHRGSRRQWLLVLQGLAVAGASALAFVDLRQGFTVIFAALLLFNLLAACQDIATDGLAVRLLDTRERGAGNAVQVGAYRIGMVLGGGLLLWVFDVAGWRAMFLGMAAILALTTLPVLALRREPAAADAADADAASERFDLRALALGAWQRLRQPGVLGFVSLICAYKFGDTLAASLIGPFLHDAGLTKSQIALLKGTVGSSAGLAGAAIGGAIAWRCGRRATLLGCGLAQSLSLLPYLLAARQIGGAEMLWIACVGEHLLGGLATVALFTLMMDACGRDDAGTDYSLYACAIVITQGLAQFAGGVVGDAAGYAAVFALGAALSLAGCLLLVARLDRGAGPDRLRAVWPARAGPGPRR